MKIEHKSPNASGRKEVWREEQLGEVMNWEGVPFQVDERSQHLIAQRALVILKRRLAGEPDRSIEWRTQENTIHVFDSESFLAFAEVVDEHAERVMQASWGQES